jgi:pimeloyl-ACP methyl ester carboxylesterase
MFSSSSGRKVAFQVSGDPDGSPVLFFHGTPSSRLYVPPEDISRQEQVHVVTLDRPGYGLSDEAPSDLSIAAVTEEILSVVGSEVGAPIFVVGFSGGAPYALACGAIRPNIVTSVAVVSGDAPPRLPPEPSELSPTELQLVRRVRSDPESATELLARHAEAFARDPLVYLTKPVARPDAAIRARPAVREILEASAREAGRQGSTGLVTDWLLEILPSGFTLGEIKRPVAVWYGTDDPGSAPRAAGRLLREIRTASDHRVEGGGHELVWTHWRQILQSLWTDKAVPAGR